MIIHLINQYRLWIWGAHWLSWLVVMLYLSIAIKQQYDVRHSNQYLHDVLSKQIALLKRDAFTLRSTYSARTKATLSHDHLQKNLMTLRDYAQQAGVMIRVVRIHPAPFISDKAMLVSVEAEAHFPQFLFWIKHIKKEKLPIFLYKLDLSVDRALIISARFVIDATLLDTPILPDSFLKNTAVYDPFCLHEQSRIARAYRHVERWQRWIDFSRVSFKTMYSEQQRHFALFSWRGRLFWLEQGTMLIDQGMRLQQVFHDHADFILQDGKRISIFRDRSLS